MSEGIPFVREMTFDYGAVDRLTPLIRRVIARNPGPFTFHGTGTYIVGNGQVAVIDPGPLDSDHLDALQGALAGETISHILITHTHRDHSPAAEPLKQATGAPTLAMGRHGLDQPRAKDSAHHGGDLDFIPDQRLEDGDLVQGDGWTLEAIHTPGHAANHLCFALAEEKILFSGDHVMGWSTSIISPPDGHMGDYLRSLHRLLDRDEQTYWPTHGPAITDPRRHVRALIAHREQREHAILGTLSNGARTIPDLVAELYAEVPVKLHPAAARTVLSHLIHMVESGRVQCDGPPTDQSRFAPARANEPTRHHG